MSRADIEERVLALLQERGPLTGGDIRDALPTEHPFEQWRTCVLSSQMVTQRVGTRYLRLDEKVEGYARLSPSILREFLTYTIVGSPDDPGAMEAATEALAASIRGISAAKHKLAARVVEEAVAKLPDETATDDVLAVLVAGDLVFEMAHQAPRPEKSTGQMVRGSDLDLVVVLDDEAPTTLEQHLDEVIYQQKYRYLINPSLREEIDYAIKRLSRVREQVEFEAFHDMVSCKIIDEALLLYGSPRLFAAAKELVQERGIPERLEEMRQIALQERMEAEQRLLRAPDGLTERADRNLFCGTEEVDEFE